MRKSKIVDKFLSSQGMDNALPDGRYLTCPKWGYTEREVVIFEGKLSLVSCGKYTFSQFGFFEVNDVLKPLPDL